MYHEVTSYYAGDEIKIVVAFNKTACMLLAIVGLHCNSVCMYIFSLYSELLRYTT